ncbi:short-chain dehydrogenase/reductase family 9C member 7-like [Actinia tenebrosa]|uniref:Short-chain dehydrogenase/reductase family 9C member 7-like n=1 Tax=Actinia tenebrosa TaxID=6105 RepID=A0A6P8INM1_ACTTE|nr:short-chain dehydrogenase/reductase family 9C member 7-like [Actinia tenebrosa]
MVAMAILLGFLSLVIAYLLLKFFSRSHKLNNFGSKFILITGCDSGFGRLSALRLDQLGFHVIATCLTKKGQEDLQKLCSERTTTFLLDVTSSTQIQELYSAITRSLIPQGVGLWALINNAGIFISGPIEWQSLDIYKRTADVNLWGMIDMTKTFLPLIKKAKGRVVNFSSAAGRASATFSSSYCISKYGVEAFSDALRREMKPWNVEVVIMEPGGHSTDILNVMNKRCMWKKQWDELNTGVKEEYGEEYFDRVFESFCKSIRHISSDFSKVVSAVEDAVTLQRPRDRYVVGLDAQFLCVLSMLPSSISDAFSNAIVNVPLPRKLQTE